MADLFNAIAFLYCRNCRKGMAVYKAINGKKIYNLDDKLNFTKVSIFSSIPVTLQCNLAVLEI